MVLQGIPLRVALNQLALLISRQEIKVQQTRKLADEASSFLHTGSA